jgi:hypothetical protein
MRRASTAAVAECCDPKSRMETNSSFPDIPFIETLLFLKSTFLKDSSSPSIIQSCYPPQEQVE